MGFAIITSTMFCLVSLDKAEALSFGLRTRLHLKS